MIIMIETKLDKKLLLFQIIKLREMLYEKLFSDKFIILKLKEYLEFYFYCS